MHPFKLLLGRSNLCANAFASNPEVFDTHSPLCLANIPLLLLLFFSLSVPLSPHASSFTNVSFFSTSKCRKPFSCINWITCGPIFSRNILFCAGCYIRCTFFPLISPLPFLHGLCFVRNFCIHSSVQINKNYIYSYFEWTDRSPKPPIWSIPPIRPVRKHDSISCKTQAAGTFKCLSLLRNLIDRYGNMYKRQPMIWANSSNP